MLLVFAITFSQSGDVFADLMSVFLLLFLFVCPFFFLRHKINAKQMSKREEEQKKKILPKPKKKKTERERERRRKREKNERATKQIICTYVFVDLFARGKKSAQRKKNDVDDDEDAQKKGKIARCAI